MTVPEWLRRAAREPLVHFVLLGAAMFVLFALVRKQADIEPDRIVVTPSQVKHLATGFTLTWRRPPNAEELKGLVSDYIREEVYYREAVALGLERDDSVIRRRLQQKMEFVAQDVGSLAEPTDADLQAFIDKHPQQFQREERYTFEQRFFNPQRHPATMDRDIQAALAELRRANADDTVSDIGDTFLLADHFDAIPAGEVVKLFGEDFASSVRAAAPGQWMGPVKSGYGLHLVRLVAKSGSQPVALGDAGVRESVRTAWSSAQRARINEAYYQRLLSRYTVVVEEPAIPEGGGTKGPDARK